MPVRKKPLRVPQTPLIDVADALATICATVDVAASALAREENEALAGNAAQVLLEHVYEPLAKQREAIEAHAKFRHVEPLLRPKRRKKHAPNGSRKGKRRQRNRWKDRQKAKKPWDL